MLLVGLVTANGSYFVMTADISTYSVLGNAGLQDIRVVYLFLGL
jgi:hypothetical protein